MNSMKGTTYVGSVKRRFYPIPLTEFPLAKLVLLGKGSTGILS